MDDEEIIIWLDDKFSLSHQYEYDGEGYGCDSYYMNWKLSVVANCGEYTLIIGGYIYQDQTSFIHSKALSAAKKIREGKSFDLEDYFLNSNIDFSIRWNSENNTFEQENYWESTIGKTIFAFPLDGAKALVEDMTNILKELKWIPLS